MSEAIKINQGVVSTLAGTDLVVGTDSGGTLKPITLDNLLALVRSNLQIGGRNLLRSSNIERSVSGASKGIGYSLAPLEIGKTYMVTLCISVTERVPRAVFSFHGSSFYNTLQEWGIDPCEKKIISQLVTVTRATAGGYFWIENGNATCHWATVTESNVPSAGWFPAPEDLGWGGVNQRFTTTYDLPHAAVQKGGYHERANSLPLSAESGTDSHLTFRSIDAACEWVGRAIEDRSCVNGSIGTNGKICLRRRSERLDSHRYLPILSTVGTPSVRSQYCGSGDVRIQSRAGVCNTDFNRHVMARWGSRNILPEQDSKRMDLMEQDCNVNSQHSVLTLSGKEVDYV